MQVAERPFELECLLSGRKWNIYQTLSLSSAMILLQKTVIPLVICERDLDAGTWKDMLHRLTRLPQPPCLIVIPGLPMKTYGRKR